MFKYLLLGIFFSKFSVWEFFDAWYHETVQEQLGRHTLGKSDFSLSWSAACCPGSGKPFLKDKLVHCTSVTVLFLVRVHTRGFCNTQGLWTGCHFRNGKSFIVGDGGGKLGFRCSSSSSQKYCSAVWLTSCTHGSNPRIARHIGDTEMICCGTMAGESDHTLRIV